MSWEPRWIEQSAVTVRELALNQTQKSGCEFWPLKNIVQIYLSVHVLCQSGLLIGLYVHRITFSYPMFKDTTGPGQYKVTVRWAAIRNIHQKHWVFCHCSTESKSPSPVVMLSGVEVSVVFLLCGSLLAMGLLHAVVGNGQLPSSCWLRPALHCG